MSQTRTVSLYFVCMAVCVVSATSCTSAYKSSMAVPDLYAPVGAQAVMASPSPLASFSWQEDPNKVYWVGHNTEAYDHLGVSTRA